MKYNFDEIIPRRGTNSYKWDSAEDADVLPMWVADMDFRTAPPVVEALKKRIEEKKQLYTGVCTITLSPGSVNALITADIAGTTPVV